jgi:hypothetical protein
MRSNPVNAGDAGTAAQYDNLRDDAYGGSLLLTHQQTTPGMTLYVEPGTYYIGTTRIIIAGGSTPTFTAPVTYPRIDLVTADSTGTIAIVQGTEASTPVAPAYPSNKVVLCEVYNVVGETALYDLVNEVSGQGYISNDVRPFVKPTYIGSASQVAANLFIPWIASPVQGDIAYFNGTAWARLPAGTSGFFLETQGASANPQWASAISAQGFITNTNLYNDSSSNAISSVTASTIHEIQLQAGAPTLTYTIQGTIRGYNSGTCYYQIYKNGVSVGTLHSTASTTDVSFTDSVSATAGDLIQLYAYASSSGSPYGYVDGFAIIGFPVPSSLIPTKNS